MDTIKLVLTAQGTDNPGIVDKISQYILSRDGNIKDSRMAVLAGEIAIIILITGTPEAIDNIKKDIKELEDSTNLSTILKDSPSLKKNKNNIPYKITLVCLDHPGIVRGVSSMLARKNINIESMETSAYEAPITGSQLFKFEAVVSIPASVSPVEIRKEIENIREHENLDIKIETAG